MVNNNLTAAGCQHELKIIDEMHIGEDVINVKLNLKE